MDDFDPPYSTTKETRKAMARTVEMMTIAEALSKADKAFVRVRGRVVSPPRTDTVNGASGPWMKSRFQIEDETGRADVEWCKPTGSIEVGDWIEAGPSTDGAGKFGGCSISEYNGKKKISAWENRLRKTAAPSSGGAVETGGQPAGAPPRGGALLWAQAVDLWDATWTVIGSSAAPGEVCGLAAVELYKAALAGRVAPPPAPQREEEPVFEEPYDDIPF